MSALGQGSGTLTRLACALLSACLLVALPTLSGCSTKSPEEAKEELEKLKKKEKPKPNFDRLRVLAEPNEKNYVDPKEKVDTAVVQAIKPGHWSSMLVQTKANNFDFSGEMVSHPRDAKDKPVELVRSPFRLDLVRPAVLPKGQGKVLEALIYAAPSTHRRTTFVVNTLNGRQSGTQEWQEQAEPLAHMPSFQYYMVALSRDPNRYRFLKVLDTVRPPSATMSSTPEDTSHYRVVVANPRVNQPVALARNPLCWTSVAYVVWDDFLPTTLSGEQQAAMIDWLHWGGGLIISGPQSLDLLRGTFLDPYLPATASETTTYDTQALAELSNYWSVPRSDGERAPLAPGAAWSGVKLATHAEASFVPNTGQLVAERRVGRGRVVVTAFRLSEKALLNWPSFDSFFNACLLRRPPREFSFDKHEMTFVGQSRVEGVARFDPELVSNVRFLSRDLKDPQAAVRHAAPTASSSPEPDAMDVWSPDTVDGYKSDPGVGGWNDFSWISSAARTSLREAAGISVPKREFVLWMVGIYLVAVVPVNWIIFRLLGRVEWAWFAVPVCAIAWGLAVIWLAQLDIGFARAEREISVLEIQNGFPRAHLTRYTALYSSLSTTYDAHFDDTSAVAQPFSVDLQLLSGQSPSTVTFRTFGENTLTDFLISSNSTGMLHSEQMFDLGGALKWESTGGRNGILENNSKLKLHGLALVGRNLEDGEYVWAWIGDLLPDARSEVTLRDDETGDLHAEREKLALTCEVRPEGELSLRRMIDIVQSEKSLEPGELRLVGWMNDGLPGMSITPAASQSRRATLVVANLQFAKPAAPRPDRQLRTADSGPIDFETLPANDADKPQ